MDAGGGSQAVIYVLFVEMECQGMNKMGLMMARAFIVSVRLSISLIQSSIRVLDMGPDGRSPAGQPPTCL